MADQTFKLRRGRAVGAFLMAFPVGLCLLLAWVAAADGDDAYSVGYIVFAVVVVAVTFYDLRYRPFEVTLTDEGVQLRSHARDRFIPWWSLASVRLRVGRYSSLTWQQRDGRTVRSAVFVDVARLLAEIGRRSPETSLS